MSEPARRDVAVATVQAFAERSGAQRVVLLLDEGDAAAPTLIDLSESGLEVTAGDAAIAAPETAAAPAALPEIRPAPASAMVVDPEAGELEAPLGAIANLAEAVRGLARAFGGRSVATAEFATRDPGRQITIAAREGDPIVLAVGDRHFALPEDAA